MSTESIQEAQGRVKDLSHARATIQAKGIIMPWQKGYKDNLEKRAPKIEESAKEMSAKAEAEAVAQVAAIAAASPKAARENAKKEEAKQ